MFDGVGWGEIVVLLLIGLFVFGPDRLPKAARDAGRLLRQLRQMATGVREDIRSELGPELADLDLTTLHPKTFVRKHLLEDDDDPLFKPYVGGKGSLSRALFDDLGDPPKLTKTTTGPSITKDLNGRSASTVKASSMVKQSALPSSASSTAAAVSAASEGSQAAVSLPATPYDLDAT